MIRVGKKNKNSQQIKCNCNVKLRFFSGNHTEVRGKPLSWKTLATEEQKLLSVQCSDQAEAELDCRIQEEQVNSVLILLNIAL